MLEIRDRLNICIQIILLESLIYVIHLKASKLVDTGYMIEMFHTNI